MAGSYMVFKDTGDNTDINSAAEFDKLPAETKALALQWIATHIVPAKSVNRDQTSYGMKHIFQEYTREYLTNGAMKGAMLAAGYEPADAGRTNWCWRIRKVRDPRFA